MEGRCDSEGKEKAGVEERRAERSLEAQQAAKDSCPGCLGSGVDQMNKRGAGGQMDGEVLRMGKSVEMEVEGDFAV